MKQAFSLRPAVKLSGISLLALLISTGLTGCGSLTGLDAASSFSCPMKNGTACRSLSDTYNDAVAGVDVPEETIEEQTSPQDDAVRFESDATEVKSVQTASPEPAPASDALSQPAPSEPQKAAPLPQPTTAPSAVLQNARLPKRLPEVIVTIHIAPWTDDEGDFHEGETIYARASDARWASAHRRAETAKKRPAVVSLPFDRVRSTDTASSRPAQRVSDQIGAAELRAAREDMKAAINAGTAYGEVP